MGAFHGGTIGRGLLASVRFNVLSRWRTRFLSGRTSLLTELLVPSRSFSVILSMVVSSSVTAASWHRLSELVGMELLTMISYYDSDYGDDCYLVIRHVVNRLGYAVWRRNLVCSSILREMSK